MGDELATSMTTIELNAENAETILLLTESEVFLDAQEQPSWREQGTADWLASWTSNFLPTDWSCVMIAHVLAVVPVSGISVAREW